MSRPEPGPFPNPCTGPTISRWPQRGAGASAGPQSTEKTFAARVGRRSLSSGSAVAAGFSAWTSGSLANAPVTDESPNDTWARPCGSGSNLLPTSIGSWRKYERAGSRARTRPFRAGRRQKVMPCRLRRARLRAPGNPPNARGRRRGRTAAGDRSFPRAGIAICPPSTTESVLSSNRSGCRRTLPSISGAPASTCMYVRTVGPSSCSTSVENDGIARSGGSPFVSIRRTLAASRGRLLCVVGHHHGSGDFVVNRPT